MNKTENRNCPATVSQHLQSPNLKYQISGLGADTRSETDRGADEQNRHDLEIIFLFSVCTVSLQIEAQRGCHYTTVAHRTDRSASNNCRVQRLRCPVFPKVSWGVNNLVAFHSPARQVLKTVHRSGS
jgi:hypothetical protein